MVQTLQLDCPVTDLLGPASGTVAWLSDSFASGRDAGKAGAVPARDWAEAPEDSTKPVYFEFMLGSWSPTGAYNGTYDAMPGASTVLVRGVVRSGKIGAATGQ